MKYGIFTMNAQDIARLREACDRTERPAELGTIEVTASVKGRLGKARVESLQEAGVDRLMLLPRPGVHDEALVRWVEESATELGIG